MNGIVCTCWRLRPDGTHGDSCPVAIAEAPALTYDGTEGSNPAPASEERARRRAEDGSAAASQVAILADLGAHGMFGSTCHEAERRLGMSHETYTGARTNLHRRGDIVRLLERRERRHVYVMPEYVMSRDVVPFRPHPRRDATPEVAAAADEISAWVRMVEDTGLLVTAPDFDSIRLLIHHAKGTP